MCRFFAGMYQCIQRVIDRTVELVIAHIIAHFILSILINSNWSTPTLMNCPMYLLLFIFTLIRSCIISKSAQNIQSLTHSSSPLLEANNPKIQEIETGKIPKNFNKNNPISDIDSNSFQKTVQQ